MFEKLLNTYKANISNVRSIIQTNEELRKIISKKNSSNEETVLNNLKKVVPNIDNWKEYQHCAVVTRLYSIYEGFVENLIKDWISLLPSIFTNYSELDQKIKDTHVRGVGKLLQEISRAC